MSNLNILVLIMSLCMLCASVLANDHMYEIGLKYSNGNITYTTLQVKPVEKMLTPKQGGYSAEIVSFDEHILNVTMFGLSRKAYYDAVNPQTGDVSSGGVMLLDDVETTLRLPYYDNAQKIVIYNESHDLRLIIDVSSYAKESQQTNVDVMQEKPIEIKQAQQSIQQQTNYTALLIIGLSIVCFIFILVLVLKRKK